jgi:hypothetical protein
LPGRKEDSRSSQQNEYIIHPLGVFTQIFRNDPGQYQNRQEETMYQAEERTYDTERICFMIIQVHAKKSF